MSMEYMIGGFVSVVCIATVVLYMYARFKRGIEYQRYITNAAPGEYLYVDLKKQKTYGSHGVYRYFGVRKSDLQTTEQLLDLVGDGRHVLSDYIQLLVQKKKQDLSHIVNINGHSSHVRLYAVEDKWEDVVAIVFWIFEVTAYEKRIADTIVEKQETIEQVKQLESICNHTPVALWCRDSEGNITYHNQLFEEVIQPNITVLDQLEAADNGAVRCYKGHLVINGKRRHFELKEAALPQGGVFGCATETTDIKAMEVELKYHEKATSEFLDVSSSAMAVYGRDMRLQHYNSAFLDLWGLKEEWLGNRPTYLEILEILRKERKLPEQADYQKFRNKQISLFKDLIEPYDDFYHLPNGKTLRVIAIPHALGGVLFAYEDLTDRLAMECSYNTLIAVQKETLDNLNEAVIALGEDGRVQLYNPKYIELWPDSEEILRTNPHITELMDHSQSLIGNQENWEKLKQRFIAQSAERILNTMRIERADGKVIDCTSIPLPDGATLISYVDVTDSTLLERSLRERNEALEEAGRIKTDFLANVSYELRTPLTSILGLTEVLEKQFFGSLNAQQEGYVKDIQAASSQLLVLINDVLDMASIEAGYLELDKGECQLDELLQSLSQVLEEKASEKGLAITVECADNFPAIQADERRLKQAILNIFNNAFSFSKRKGRIDISVGVEEGAIVLSIKDNGVGMSEREQKQAFDRFYRSTRMKSGAGLGLSVAKNIVEMHGGRISITSEKGTGTTVSCYFDHVVEKKKQIAA